MQSATMLSVCVRRFERTNSDVTTMRVSSDVFFDLSSLAILFGLASFNIIT